MLISDDMAITILLILEEFTIQKRKYNNSELRGRRPNQRCAIICTYFNKTINEMLWDIRRNTDDGDDDDDDDDVCV